MSELRIQIATLAKTLETLRQYIMEKLAANKEIQNQLSVALQKHSEVMSELRIQIATLAKTLETLEDRMER